MITCGLPVGSVALSSGAARGPWDKSSSALTRSTPLAASVLGVRLREVPGFSLSSV